MNKNLYLNDSEKEWILKVKSILSKPQPPIPNNEIHYTSSDGNIVTPNNPSAFGANIVSNVYENGVGIITFDGDVTSIGQYTFAGSGLTSIAIPDSVTSIGQSAFISCITLTSITIGNSITSIGGNAFQNCRSLTSITIPNSVTSIGYNAFSNCTSLTSVTIGNSMTSIGESAFQNCSGLISITSLNTTPPTLANSSTLPSHTTYTIYVSSESVDRYKAASVWSSKASQIQAIQQ